MNRIVMGVALLVALAGGVSPALADGGYRPEVRLLPPAEGLRWNPWAGEYRFAVHHVGEFVLDEEGTASPIDTWGEHRIRLAPALAWGILGIQVELDVLAGGLLGDREDLFPDGVRLDRRDQHDGRSLDSFLLRQAYAQVVTPVGLVRVGQMTSTYGLGIMAHTGADDDDRFGLARYGDIVDRALLLLKPFRPLTGANGWGDYLAFMGAADLVFRDENADWLAGDRAYMGDAGIFWLHPDFTTQAVFTYRNQVDEDGDSLEAYVVNVNGHNRMTITTRPNPEAGGGQPERVPDMALSLGYELVWLWGHTDRFQQIGSEEGLDLESFGAVGRLGFDWSSIGLGASLEVGYASGDHNAYDDTSHAFYFDPDYNVGLIFFDEMLPLISARAAEISGDPANLAVPPKGLDLVPSQGRVTNTLYALPQLSWTWQTGDPWFERFKLLGGALILTTPTEFAHSYYTFRNGGTAANHLGAPVESNHLGTELLAGLRTTVRLWPDHVALTFRVDQSYFMPGQALADADGELPDGVWKILAAFALQWQ